MRQFFYKNILKRLQYIQYGSIVLITPDDKIRHFSGKYPGISAFFHVKDWKTFSAVAMKSDIGLAESYYKGWWDTDDIAELLQFALQNESTLQGYFKPSWISRIASRINYYLNRNNLKGSKRNICSHYDLGNDFYSIWLDKGMTYSSGLFSSDDVSIEVAQQFKYQRILDQLSTTSGSLLEIGCGWGGFLEEALAAGDFDAKGITLSEEQFKYARERLDNSADVVLEDYRLQHEKYDHIVSIEMFEAVGKKYWPAYFNKIKSMLKSKGQAVIQTITMHEDNYESYSRSTDILRSYIFPGGFLPSLTDFVKTANDAGLQVSNQFGFGKDYAKTLEVWLHNFDSHINKVKALGYSEDFIRLWESSQLTV